MFAIFGSQIGVGEILLIVLIALLLFGAKKLPEVGRAFGKGIRQFKKGLNDVEEDVNANQVNKQIENPYASEPPKAIEGTKPTTKRKKASATAKKSATKKSGQTAKSTRNESE